MLCSGVVVMREEKLPASCTELSTFSPLGSTAVRIEGLAELIPPGHLKTALRPFGVQPTGRVERLGDDGAVGEGIGTVEGAVVGGVDPVGRSSLAMIFPVAPSVRHSSALAPRVRRLPRRERLLDPELRGAPARGERDKPWEAKLRKAVGV